MATDISGFNHQKLRDGALGLEYFKTAEYNSKFLAQFFADMLRNNRFEPYKQTTSKTHGDDKEPYEIDEVTDNATVDILASSLHEMYFDFITNKIGAKAGQNKSALIQEIKTKYASVIHPHKSGQNKYKFETRKLWKYLVYQKWVVESSSLDVSHIRLEMKVDPRFFHLSRLKEDTPLEHRHQVNPAKKRFNELTN